MKIAVRMAGISAEIRKPTLSSGNRVSKSVARWKAWFYLPLSASIQPTTQLSGTFAKLRKASTSFVMSVCSSEWNTSAPTRRIFMKFDIFGVFRKPDEKIRVWILKRKTGIYVRTNTHIWLHLAQFLLEWEIFRTNIVEEIKKHILCSVTFFLEKVPFLR